MREGSLSGHGRTERRRPPDWRDGKRYLWLLGTVVPLFLFLGWGLVNAHRPGAGSGGSARSWSTCSIPLLDVAIGDDASNAPEDAVAWLEQDRYYRWVTYLFLPCQFAAFFTRASG